MTKTVQCLGYEVDIIKGRDGKLRAYSLSQAAANKVQAKLDAGKSV